MTGKPVNLNRVRKARAKVRDKARADENAVRFGRTRARKLLEQAKADRMRAALDRQARQDL